MTENGLNLFSIAQGGLAIVGFIALSAWLVRWSSLFFAKHRELSELDKELNIRLRDALELERKQGSIDREKLQREASQALERLTKVEGTVDATKEESKNLRSALHLAIGASTSMLTEVGKSQLEAHIEDVRDFALAMRACQIAPRDSVDWIARGVSEFLCVRRLKTFPRRRARAPKTHLSARRGGKVGSEASYAWARVKRSW